MKNYLKKSQFLSKILFLILSQIAIFAQEINITNVDIIDHPRICVTARAKDTVGDYLIGLDSSNFNVWQNQRDGSHIIDNSNVIFPLDVTAALIGLNTILLIDETGSMDTVLINIAKNSVYEFITKMEPYDKTGIVGFRGPNYFGIEKTKVHSYLSSDTNDLNTKASGLYFYNTGRNYIDGVFEAIEVLKNAHGPKIILSMSIGVVGGSTHSFAEVIDSVTKYNVSVYAVGVGKTILPQAPSSLKRQSDSLQMLTDSLGGMTIDSITSSELSATFQKIRDDVKAQYNICYESPDITFNGDTNDVVIQINHMGNIAQDTTNWNESNLLPRILLTDSTKALFSKNLPSSTNIPISAVITDDGTIDNVSFSYRQTGTITYTDITMNQTSGDTFTVMIPGVDVNDPGVDFYFIASDNYNLKGKSPSKNYPQITPHSLSVNNTPSTINLSANNCLDTAQLSIDYQDPDGVEKIVIHHKLPGEPFFSNDTITVPLSTSGSIHSPIQYSGMSEFFYYVQAIDADGAITRHPSFGFFTENECDQLMAPTALLLPQLNPLDTVFKDSAYIQLSSLFKGVKNDIVMYYSTDTAQVLNTSSTSIASGDSILISNTTYLKVLAYHTLNGLYSDTIKTHFYQLTKLTAPYLEKIDNLNYSEGRFADSMKVVVHSANSNSQTKVYYTATSTFNGIDYWDDGDTVTIRDSVYYQFFSKSPLSLNSDTISAHFYPAPKLEELFLIVETDTITEPYYFSDSTCFYFGTKEQNALVYFSFDDAGKQLTTSAVGKLMCVDSATTVYAYAHVANKQPSGVTSWDLVEYQKVTMPIIEPVLDPVSAQYADITILSTYPNALMYYTVDGSIPDNQAILYTQPFRVDTSMVVKAIAVMVGDGYLPSDETIYSMTPLSDTPLLFIDSVPALPDNYYSDSVCFNFRTSESKTQFYYSFNEPNSLIISATQGEMICIDSTSTLFAYAHTEGKKPSQIAKWSFVEYIKVSAPTIIPESNYFYSTYIDVEILNTFTGLNPDIHYTLDGSEPTILSPLYNAPFRLDSNKTIRAIAYIPQQKYLISDIVTKNFSKSFKMVSAFMGDVDNNGHGDHVEIQFLQKLPLLPQSIHALFWSQSASENNIIIESEMIGFKESDGSVDSSVVVLDLFNIQESITGTGILSLDSPYVELPHKEMWGEQKAVLKDGVSPLLISVIKEPHKPTGPHELGQAGVPDALIFSFSEPLSINSTDTLSAFVAQFVHDDDCADGYKAALNITGVQIADSLGMKWRILVTDPIPNVHSCIRATNANAITDINTNRLAETAVAVDGTNRLLSVGIHLNQEIVDERDPLSYEGIEPKAALTIQSNNRSYTITVFIFDSMGNFIRTLVLSNSLVNNAEGTKEEQEQLFWDLKSDDGKNVGTGVYIWRAIVDYENGDVDRFTVRSGYIRD